MRTLTMTVRALRTQDRSPLPVARRESNHGKSRAFLWRRKCHVDRGERCSGKVDGSCRAIFTYVRDVTRLRNADDLLAPQEPRECQLRGRDTRFFSDANQRSVTQQRAFADGRVSHDGDRALDAARQQRKLDATFADVIKHLIDDATITVGQREQLVDVVGVEVGDTPADDLAFAAQPLECADRFGERYSTSPMQ